MPATNLRLSPLEERLLKAPEPKWANKWFEFSEVSYIEICSLSEADIPELIRTAQKWVDDDWLASADCETQEVQLLPVTAWRALAELNASDAVEPILELCLQREGTEDDWSFEDFSHVISAMGEPAIPFLTSFLADSSIGPDARIIALESLIKLGKPGRDDVSSESRDTIRSFFLEAARNVADHPEAVDERDDAWQLDFARVNAQILSGVLDLRIVEAAPFVEKAFSLNQFDIGMFGDWQIVRKKLGVESRGLPMPDMPLDSIQSYRRERGFGIFSDQPLFKNDDQDFEAVEVYMANAMTAFESSDEGREVIDRFGGLGWVGTFLEIGLSYLGVTVDTMTPGDAQEIVFEVFPRKVCVEGSEAGCIIFELRQFWRFIERVHRLPAAADIASLFDGQSKQRLREELSDERNFGMAKSMHLMGKSAGFDMYTEAGLNEFREAYNAQLALTSQIGESEPGPPSSPMAGMTAKERKAFNKTRKRKLARKQKQSKK